MGRPILFRQIRAGLNGRPFVMAKFRTMCDLRDSSGQLLSNEARLTRIGRFRGRRASMSYRNCGMS